MNEFFEASDDQPPSPGDEPGRTGPEDPSNAPEQKNPPVPLGKRLWRGKWTRRSIRSVAVLATLTVVGYAGIDGWGARKKAQALKDLAAHGIALDRPEPPPPLPPADENFGALQLFQDLKLKKPPAESLPDDFWINRRPGFRLPRSHEPLDPAMLKDYLPGADMPEARWLAFEGHNRELLAALRQGISRRYAVSLPWLDTSDPEVAYHTSAEHLLRQRHFRDWLICRAYLAIESRHSDDALESLLILRRLADLLRTEDTLVGKLVGQVLDHTLAKPLACGIDSGIWNEAQLTRLEQALTRPNEPSPWHDTLRMEARISISLLNHLKDHPELWQQNYAVVGSTTSQKLARWLPDGILDLAQQRELRILDETTEAIKRDSIAKRWQAGNAYETVPAVNSEGLVEGLLHGTAFRMVALTVLKTSASGDFDTRQARLACRLAIYKAQHGSYPATLEELGAQDLLTDPFSPDGKPFRYRLEPDGKFTLYSVGPNGIDDGGKGPVNSHQNWSEAPDWVW
jgi:hypothetical protein